MTDFVKIAVLSSETAASLLAASLKDRGIPHIIKAYHDSALDGLFELQRGWGHVEAPAEHRDEVLAVLDDIGQAPDPGGNGAPQQPAN